MKTFGICAMMALATLCVAPAMADDASYSKAVALAAPDSEAGIEEIAYALYLAVKEDPAIAADALAAVLAQRTDWTADDVYTLFTAVMMARPDLTIPVKDHVGPGGSDDASTADSAELPVLADDVKGTLLGQLINVLYTSKLPAGVARSVLRSAGFGDSVVAEPSASAAGSSPTGTPESGAAPSESASSEVSLNDMANLNQAVINGSLGAGTVTEEIKEPAVNPPGTEYVPTPAPTSPQGSM